MMTAFDIAYEIMIVKNHEVVWKRNHFKETLQEEELLKYDNYKTLEEEGGKVKYSPKIPRFGGGMRVKRTFGSVMWNKNGMTFFHDTIKIWKHHPH